MQGMLPNSAFDYNMYAGVGWVSGLPATARANMDCQMAMANALWTPMNNLYNNDLRIDWLQFIDERREGRLAGQTTARRHRQPEEPGAEHRPARCAASSAATSSARRSPRWRSSPTSTRASPHSMRANVSPWLAPPQTGLHADKVWWAVMDAALAVGEEPRPTTPSRGSSRR